MNILVLGGFLGSGKTTLLQSLLQGLDRAGKSVAVIENEIGTVGIDDAILEESSLSVTPLFGGCVCCQFSGQLVSALEQIEESLNPDWVTVEMTGLALMDNIRQTLHKTGNPDWKIITASIVDMARWQHLVGALYHIFQHQVPGTDHLLLNKTDVCMPDESHMNILRQLAPEAKITVLTPENKQVRALLRLIFGIEVEQ